MNESYTLLHHGAGLAPRRPLRHQHKGAQILLLLVVVVVVMCLLLNYIIFIYKYIKVVARTATQRSAATIDRYSQICNDYNTNTTTTNNNNNVDTTNTTTTNTI